MLIISSSCAISSLDSSIGLDAENSLKDIIEDTTILSPAEAIALKRRKELIATLLEILTDSMIAISETMALKSAQH